MNKVKSYPLYDNLLEKVKQRTDKSIDIKRVCTTINNIPQFLDEKETADHYDEIFALIIHHDLLNNGGLILSNVPFDGKTMVGGRGVLYNIAKFPPSLLQIIAQYIDEYCH